MNENEQAVVNALMKHTAWGLEGLRLETPDTNDVLSEKIAELMVSSLALDDGAFIAFIAQVMETRASMKAKLAELVRRLA